MLSIRLTRVGRKKAPTYRVVVMPKTRDPWGKALEILGHYNPRTTPRTIELKADRIKHWLSEGAEASDSVWNLLVDQKIVEDKKRTVTHISKKRQGKLEDKAVAKKEKAAEAKAKAAEEKKAAAEAKVAEEAAAKEAAEAEKAKAAEEAKVAAEAPVEEAKEAPTKTEAPEAPSEEVAKEKKEETPAEEKTAE